MVPGLLLTLLAADPQPAPAVDARAALESAQRHVAASESAAASDDLFRAFSFDPELLLPADASAELRTLAEAARARAVAALKARLDEAATRSTWAFSAPPAPVAANPPPARPAPRAVSDAEQEPPPPKHNGLLNEKLGVGVLGFWDFQDSRLGPAVELNGGDTFGPVRLSGVGTLMIGPSLAFTAALRLAVFMRTKVGYMGGLDAGIFYGGANKLLVPFGTAHVGGLRVLAGPVVIEARIASLSIFYVGGGQFRFVPQMGVGVVL